MRLVTLLEGCHWSTLQKQHECTPSIGFHHFQSLLEIYPSLLLLCKEETKYDGGHVLLAFFVVVYLCFWVFFEKESGELLK